MMPRSTVVLSDVPEIVGIDDYNSAKAKQRASVRWLVSKAYNNKVPSNLQEPYYRDQNDGSERLKPQLVHALANAELYCSCLANIYADPNYHNLSHWGIIQALARKGVYVAEPSDVALTETVLIQTGPIRISAHMAVMEAVMALYIREVITAERVVGVVRRFSSLQASTELPVDQEEALLLWINKSCATLQAQASAECRANQEEGGVPTFPLLQDLSDLSDGTCLAGLISLYCPDELSWPQIALSEPPRIADSLYNLQLVEKFCSEALPYNTFFLSLEDILYMHSSVKQNFLVLLSDLFYLFEISPAKCVRTPSSVKDRVIELRRQNSLNSSGSPRRSQPELRSPSNSQQDSFSGGVSARSEPPIVVRRARNSRAASDNRGRQRYSMYEGCDGGAAWTSVYPDWWWRCSHPPTEPCHYCSRPGNTPFHQQCYHHVAAAGTTATGDYVSSANNPYNGGVVGDHRRPLSVYQPNDATSYRDDDRSNSADSDFVVQRAQGPMTLSRMVQHRRPQQPPGQLQQQRSLSPGSVHSDELVPPRPPRRHRQSASQAQSECGDDRLDDRQHFAFTQQQPSPAAGRPTVGRLSRRGSFSEDSQLTVENFGGSQDNMHMLGRNPDKQPVVHQGRRPTRDSSQHRDLLKESNISFGDRDPFQEAERDRAAAMSRSVSRQDLYDPAEQFQQQPVRPPSRNLFHESSIKAHFGGDDSTPQTRAARSASAVSSEMEAFEREAVRRVESHAKNGSANNNLVIMLDANDDGVEEGGQQPLNHQQQQQYQKPTSSFAQLSASKNGAAGINVVYMQGGNGSQGNPSTRATSWGQQQQSRNRLQEQPQRLTNGAAEEAGDTMASEMHNIKLRLEEKRRSIESEKRRLEGAMEQHKQSMGKQAFLQAIGQGKCLSSAGPVDKTAAASASASGSISGSGSGTRTSDSVASQPSPEEATEEDGQMMADSMEMQHPPRSQRSHLTLQDVGQNMNQLQSKWSRIPEPINSPDLDNMDYDQYQNSLQTMNESLTELQDDIQRLSQQQSQVQHMQHMMHNGGPHSPSQAPPPLSHHQPPYHHLPPQQQQHHYQSPAGLYGPPAAHPQQTSQFFLHDQQPHPGAAGHRRQWGQPMAPEDIYQQMSSPGRARWAQPVRQPIMPQQQPPNPYGAPPHQSPYYDSPGNYQHHPPPLHHHQQQPQHLPHLQDPSAGYHQGYQHPQHMGGMMPGHTLPQPPPSTTSAMSRYPDYGGGMGGVYGGGELVRPSPVAADSNGVGGFRLHEPGSSAGLLPERVYSGSEYRQPVTRPPQRRQQSPVLHAPLPAPSLDDMEPQSVSFIGGEREEDASEVARQRLAALAVNDDADASPGNRTFRVHRGSSDNLPADSARRRPLVTSRTYKVPRRTPSPGNGVDSPAWAGPGRGASQSPPRYEPASRQSPPKLSQDAVTSRRFSGATRSQSPAKRDHCTPDRQLSSRGDQHQLPQDQEEDEISHEVLAAMKVDKISADANPDLGFVISFESDAAPRKPKPKLGARRGVSKASSNTSVDSADRRPPPPMTSTPQQPPISSGKAASAFSTYTRRSGAGIDGGIEGADQPLSLRGLSSRIGEDRQDAADKFEVDESVPLEEMRPLRQERGDSTLAPMGVGLVIGDQLASPKSETLDEMDRKKERILMMSLKRKEQSEAARRKKEEDTLRRKEEEARKEEEKLRKKEEDKERKERIFEQYKLKKAIEEAEKNGTAPPPMPAGRPAAAGGPPVRSRARPPSAGGRPARPRSVVERGAADPAVTPSRGVHGSSSNLAAMSECDSAARPPVAPPPAPSSAVSLARHRSLSRHRHSHIAVTARSSSLTNSAGRHNNENNANRTPADKARSSGGGAGSRWGSNTSLSGGGSRSRRGSNSSLYGTESRYGRPVASHSGRKTDNDASTPGGGMSKDGGHRTSTGSLSGPRRSRSRLGSRTNSSNSLYDDPDAGYRSSQFAHSGRRVSAVGGAARGALSKSRPDINRTFSKGSLGATAPAHKSLANLFGGGSGIPRYSETDSGLGRDTPTRRGVSPGVFARPSRRLTSPSGPGSLPPGLVSRRRNLGDDASDVSSVASYDYNGPRLFKQPASKSNRSMMLNAVEYCVFPGAVNREAKHRVLEEIASCEAKHFLILFRDARCQFRALYWYEPETEEVVKLYGTGPKQASDNMFDRFFKYNSGGKCFSQIHTKHLSATIDAFTIHDALWQGKRPSLPSKRDMKLVT